MFSYYGTKKRIVDLYDKPQYRTIIEPFAGAAAYSCRYPEYDVILCDLNPKICLVWNYLIHASSLDIEALPDIEPGQKVTDFILSPAETALIGFCINPGSSTPKITASKRSKWASYKKNLAEFVPKIKHWTILEQSYLVLPNIQATWFIDPPYQQAGKYYFGFTGLNFQELGAWCQSRDGQVIVCENLGADWLPFQKLVDHRGSIKMNTEAIYTQG